VNGGELLQRRTSLIAVALALVVVLVAVLLFVSSPRGPNVSPPSPPVAQARPLTVPQLIMQRHADRDGLLDFEGTLEIFSYAFEPLPGVSLPAGPADEPGRWTDLAMRSILPHRAELTDAQRAVVASYLVAAKPVASRPGDQHGTHLVSYLASVDRTRSSSASKPWSRPRSNGRPRSSGTP